MAPLALPWFPPVQRIGGLLSPHGLAAAAGFLLGAQLLLREVRRRGDLDEGVLVRALTWAALGAIAGARIDYLISHPGDFDTVWEAVKLWEGGLALFGGFIGGVAAALPTLIRARVHLPRLLDAAAPSFALGVVVGRIGDLVIWDHLGDRATGWARPLGLTVRAGYDLAPGFELAERGVSCAEAARQQLFQVGCAYHQPALYDLTGALLLFGLLLLLRRRTRARAGVAICVWGAWYGVQRLVIDVTRSIDERPLLGLTGTQLLGILLAAGCLGTLLTITARGRGLGERAGDPPSREGSLCREPGADGQDGPSVAASESDSESGSASDSDASSMPSANPLA